MLSKFPTFNSAGDLPFNVKHSISSNSMEMEIAKKRRKNKKKKMFVETKTKLCDTVYTIYILVH